MKTVLGAIAGTLLALYGTAALGLYLSQRSMLYQADQRAYAPEAVGLSGFVAEPLTARDGTALVAWVARRPAAGMILYFHGNGGSLGYRADRLRQLASLGASVVAIDYRGFGGSSGTPSEAGLALDADAAYRLVRDLGIAADHILILGESLGTGVAVGLASRVPACGLVLAGAFTSVADIAADRYWAFPVRWLIRDRFDSAALLPRVAMPILILQGTDDAVTPYRYAERLARVAGPGTTFVPIENGGHLVLSSRDADVALRRWLAQRPAFAATPPLPQGNNVPL